MSTQPRTRLPACVQNLLGYSKKPLYNRDDVTWLNHSGSVLPLRIAYDNNGDGREEVPLVISIVRDSGGECSKHASITVLSD